MTTHGLCSYNVRFIMNGNIEETEKLDFMKKYGKVSFHRKGDVISRAAPPVEEDTFCFEYSLLDDPEQRLTEFSSIIKMIDLSSFGNNKCYLRIFLQSDNAQMGCSFSKKMIKILSDLNMELYISILSWGEVDDD